MTTKTKKITPGEVVSDWMDDAEIYKVEVPHPNKIFMTDLSGVRDPFIPHLMGEEAKALNEMLKDIPSAREHVYIESTIENVDVPDSIHVHAHTEDWVPIVITPKTYDRMHSVQRISA